MITILLDIALIIINVLITRYHMKTGNHKLAYFGYFIIGFITSNVVRHVLELLNS